MASASQSHVYPGRKAAQPLPKISSHPIRSLGARLKRGQRGGGSTARIATRLQTRTSASCSILAEYPSRLARRCSGTPSTRSAGYYASQAAFVTIRRLSEAAQVAGCLHLGLHAVPLLRAATMGNWGLVWGSRSPCLTFSNCPPASEGGIGTANHFKLPHDLLRLFSTNLNHGAKESQPR